MSKFTYFVLFLIAGYFVVQLVMKFSAASSGESAPELEMKLIDGTPFQLSDLKGDYVLVDFWGSWCRPCRMENPKLVALYHKYKDQEFEGGKKLKIVTIALEKTNNTWKRAAERDGFAWKHQVVEQTRFVMMSPIARKFGVSQIPAKFLISPEGKIVEVEHSFEKIDAFLASKVKAG